MTPKIKHQPLIGEILPGSLTVGFILYLYISNNAGQDIINIIKSNTWSLIVSSGIFLLAAWITGSIYDAIRNGIVECLLDKYYPISWDFFFKGDTEKVHKFEEYYFAYYALDVNYAIGIFVIIVFDLSASSWLNAQIKPLPLWILLFLIGILFIYINDARSLRKEIRRLLSEVTNNMPTHPHVNSYTRLMCSPTHGVGVFAIRDIPKGTNIFYDDNSYTIWVDKSITEGLEPEIKQLYIDFCVKRGDKYYCPNSFNNLTLGWYINNSNESPNVICTKDYDFIAAEDIKKGTELKAKYSSYSDRPDLM